MDREDDRTIDDLVCGNGMETVNGEMQQVRDAIYDVNQQVKTVDRQDPDTYRIEDVQIFFKINRHNRVAILRSLSDSRITVPFVDRNRIVCFPEADHFITRQWVACLLYTSDAADESLPV